MMLSWGSNHPDSLPFTQLQQHIGENKWEHLKKGLLGLEKIDEFLEQKLAQFAQYEQDLDKTNSNKNKMENQNFTEEELVARL